MAQLSINRPVPSTLQQRMDMADGVIVDMVMTASETIYEGAFVGFVPGTGTIHALVANDCFAGIALEKKVSDSTAGSTKCAVFICGYFQHAITSLVVADVGKVAFADTTGTASDNKLNITDTACAIGRIVNYVSAGIGIVHMKVPGARSGASADATLGYIAVEL